MEVRNLKLIISACAANLLGFATGNAYAWSSTVLVTLRNLDPTSNPLGRPVTVSEESWIASLVNLSATIGTPLSGFFSAKFGPKLTMLMFAVPMLLSHLILAFAESTMEFYVARFMLGLGIGCTYTVIPIYIGEIAETKIRGLLGCFVGLFASLGFLYVLVVGPFVSIKLLSFLLVIPLVCFLFFFGLFIPESPYYHVSKGEYVEAEESLKKLRNTDEGYNQKELEDIRETVEMYGGSKASFLDSFRNKTFRKGLTISMMLLFFQQFVGITFIQSYMETIFIASGSKMSSSVSAVMIGIVQVIGVLISASLVDMFGRRFLLIFSSIFCAIPLFILGLYFYLKNVQDVSHLWWLPVVSLGVYIISYCSGICTIPWALIGELFSTETKSLASSLSSILNFSLAFAFTFLMPMFKELVGFEGVFWFFSVSAMFSAVFVFFCVPETKGKSFQEILNLLGS